MKTLRQGPVSSWLSCCPILRRFSPGPRGVGADAEIDIIQAGTDLAEFYQLSRAALAGPKVQADVLGLEQATALIDRPADDDFLACGFVHIGVWGQRPAITSPSR